MGKPNAQRQKVSKAFRKRRKCAVTNRNLKQYRNVLPLVECSRQEIFLILKDWLDSGLDVQLKVLEDHLSVKMNDSFEIRSAEKKKLKKMLHYMKSTWSAAHRETDNFFKKHKQWLNSSVTFGATLSSANPDTRTETLTPMVKKNLLQALQNSSNLVNDNTTEFLEAQENLSLEFGVVEEKIDIKNTVLSSNNYRLEDKVEWQFNEAIKIEPNEHEENLSFPDNLPVYRNDFSVINLKTEIDTDQANRLYNAIGGRSNFNEEIKIEPADEEEENCSTAEVAVKIESQDEDEFDIRGKQFANDLRQMDMNQRKIVEKLMDEIVAAAKLNRLKPSDSLNQLVQRT